MRKLSFVLIAVCLIFIYCEKEPTKQKEILPVINSISITYYPTAQDSIFRKDIGIELVCDSYDEDGFIADYIWEATGGTIQGAAWYARWDAPALPGTYYIICTVKDNNYNLARKEYEIEVLNRAPHITKIWIFQNEPNHQPYIKVGNTAYFLIDYNDPDGDYVQYKFVFPDTTSGWMGQQFDWTAPSGLPYRNKVYGYIKDPYGGTDIDSTEFYISN